MSDINTYADEAAITDLTPINGDLVLNRDNNSLYLCTDSAASGIARWKIFTNDGAAPPVFANNRLALDFDGNEDYLDCGGASDFSFTDGSGNDLPFSISAWVKFDNRTRARVISKDVSTSSREFLFGTDATSKANIILGTGSVNLNIVNNTVLNTTDWFHLVATYDGSETSSGLLMYVNADASSLRDDSTGTYTGMSSSGGNLEIARFANGHSFFNGLVDEVAVFDYELTSSQVSDIYNETNGNGSPADISTLTPLGWWRMGDNDSGISGQSAATVSDVSGNELHATQSDVPRQPTFAALTGETIYS